MKLELGSRVMAPVKRGTSTVRKEWEEVEVVWLSRDGRVIEGRTTNKKRPVVRHSFAACVLAEVGTVKHGDAAPV